MIERQGLFTDVLFPALVDGAEPAPRMPPEELDRTVLARWQAYSGPSRFSDATQLPRCCGRAAADSSVHQRSGFGPGHGKASEQLLRRQHERADVRYSLALADALQRHLGRRCSD